MRVTRADWDNLPDRYKMAQLFEQNEELYVLVDQLSAAVARLRQQVSALQRQRPGTTR